MKLPQIKGEPAHVVAMRLARVMQRTGMLELVSGGLEIAQIAATRGLDVRTIHAIHAVTHPERIAIIDQDRWLTFSQVDARINQTARLLAEHGVQPGMRVLICMENRLEYLLTWFALFRLGVSAIHASYRSTSAELLYLLNHSHAQLMVVSAQTVQAARATHGRTTMICADDSEGCVPFSAAETQPPTPLPHKAADGASVVYTSGTTGKPKGAVRNFTSFGLVELTRLLERLPLQASTRHLVVCPLYHSAAQAFVLIHSAIGATVVVERHFDPVETLDTMRRLEISSTFLVPTMIQRLLDQAASATPPETLQCLVSGAAPFPRELRERAIRFFGANTIFDFYGATELGWVTLIRGDEMLDRPGSVGRAMPGQTIEIRDQGKKLPTGEIGTIWVSNQQIMAGYLHETDAGAEDGFLTVDDLGYLDADGYLYLAGRDRDMVISGGVNIYPVEIEEILLTHPRIHDVAVVGVPDAEWGEKLVAFVVDEVPEDVEAWLRERVSGPKVPRTWIAIEALPRNPTGKVLKRELQERAQTRT